LRVNGARVQGIYEQAPLGRLIRFGASLFRHPGKITEGVRYRLQTGLAPYRTSSRVVRAEGSGRVERVTVATGAREWTVDCDLLACGFHLVPNVELPQLLGCRLEEGFVRVDAEQRSSRNDVFCVGELTGVGGLNKALLEGEAAGYAAAERPERAAKLAPALARQRRFAREMTTAFALQPELRSLPKAETHVCRCEDVPLKAMQSRADWRDAKLHTRAGMGACQGRVCGSAAEFLFGWEKHDARPPVFPATVAAMAQDTQDND
jgi:NADPH-dependent 2,4-dienoyl-CoA reductase/sulfur reductase-like enzyme